MSKMGVACAGRWCGPFRSMWTQTSKKKFQKLSVFFSGGYPGFSQPAKTACQHRERFKKSLKKSNACVGCFWCGSCLPPIFYSIRSAVADGHGRFLSRPPCASYSRHRQASRSAAGSCCAARNGRETLAPELVAPEPRRTNSTDGRPRCYSR